MIHLFVYLRARRLYGQKDIYKKSRSAVEETCFAEKTCSFLLDGLYCQTEDHSYKYEELTSAAINKSHHISNAYFYNKIKSHSSFNRFFSGESGSRSDETSSGNLCFYTSFVPVSLYGSKEASGCFSSGQTIEKNVASQEFVFVQEASSNVSFKSYSLYSQSVSSGLRMLLSVSSKEYTRVNSEEVCCLYSSTSFVGDFAMSIRLVASEGCGSEYCFLSKIRMYFELNFLSTLRVYSEEIAVCSHTKMRSHGLSELLFAQESNISLDALESFFPRSGVSSDLYADFCFINKSGGSEYLYYLSSNKVYANESTDIFNMEFVSDTNPTLSGLEIQVSVFDYFVFTEISYVHGFEYNYAIETIASNVNSFIRLFGYNSKMQLLKASSAAKNVSFATSDNSDILFCKTDDFCIYKVEMNQIKFGE